MKDFKKLKIDELMNIDVNSLNADELHSFAIRLDKIKGDFDWYLNHGGLCAMVDDGIDYVDFKINYRKIENMNKKLDVAFENKNEDRKNFIKEFKSQQENTL